MSTSNAPPTLESRVRRTRPLPAWLAVIADSAAWLTTLLGLTVSRYLLSGDSAAVAWDQVFLDVGFVAVLCVFLTFVGGWAAGLYRHRYIVGSLDELKRMAAVLFAVWIVVSAVILVTAIIPRSVTIALYPTALVLMAAVRIGFRQMVENRSSPAGDALPVLLYGAGELGHSVGRQMLVDPLSEFRPVGFVDDDLRKKRFRIGGLSVLATGDELTDIVEATGAVAIVICVNEADSAFLRDVHEKTDALGIRMLVFPSINKALTQRRNTSSLRDVSVDDLVGRHPAKIDLSSVAGYLTGKRVLVTGAGGSIGSELSRQIHKFGPSELLILDHDESGLHSTQISLYGHGLLDTRDAILADIRDASELTTIFQKLKPEVVFHAAALKHLPMLEQYPDQAWKTNVLGTLNVLNASLDVGVERFVNISTDKAANPTSALGHSKRLAERLTAWAADKGNGNYVSVRFGNVLGSRGSMLPTFQSQIEGGGPVTVTHPDVTRFFMTIPEACELVVQAGAIGVDGQVMILHMGEPVRIIDVANRMIEMSGKEIEIIFTGLRYGEKLHEDLFSIDEQTETPLHPRISHAGVVPARPDRLEYDRWLAEATDKSNLAYSGEDESFSRRVLGRAETSFK